MKWSRSHLGLLTFFRWTGRCPIQADRSFLAKDQRNLRKMYNDLYRLIEEDLSE